MTDPDDEPATKADIVMVLAMIAEVSAALAGVAALVNRLVQLTIRGAEFQERHKPAEPEPAKSVRFRVQGEDISADQIMDALAEAQADLNRISKRRN